MSLAFNLQKISCNVHVGIIYRGLRLIRSKSSSIDLFNFSLFSLSLIENGSLFELFISYF